MGQELIFVRFPLILLSGRRKQQRGRVARRGQNHKSKGRRKSEGEDDGQQCRPQENGEGICISSFVQDELCKVL